MEIELLTAYVFMRGVQRVGEDGCTGFYRKEQQVSDWLTARC